MNNPLVSTVTEHPFAQYVRILGKGKTGTRSLTTEEAQQAMGMIMAGDVEDIQLGAFLMLLRVKEESHGELTGFVRAIRQQISLPQGISADLDWSSYAGKKKQLPWYLLSALLLADNGIKVFMHGASGHTAERIYSEHVLAALGIPAAQDWQQVQQQLQQHNFSFMPLQQLCPPLARIINFRNLFGLRSPVHTLSRLLNPLAAPCSLQSVFHPAYADTHQQAAIALGQQHAVVFKGEGGEVERRPEATGMIKQVINGAAREEQWPKLLEGRQMAEAELDPTILQQLWRGDIEHNYGYQAIIGTTAIALRALQKAANQDEAISLAKSYWQQRNTSRF